jgi:hypothetical protein
MFEAASVDHFFVVVCPSEVAPDDTFAVTFDDGGQRAAAEITTFGANVKCVAIRKEIGFASEQELIDNLILPSSIAPSEARRHVSIHECRQAVVIDNEVRRKPLCDTPSTFRNPALPVQ